MKCYAICYFWLVLKISSKKYIGVILLLSSFFFSIVCNAQSETEETKNIYRITLKGGEVVYCEIISRNNEEIVVKSELYGELTIPQNKIKELKRYNERLGNEFDEETLITSSFNFLTPTAYTLKKDESYLANKYLFYNQVNYGLNDNWQIGAGFEFLSMLFGNSPTYYLSLKAKTELADKLKLSGNLIFANGNLLSDKTLLGSIATTTYGTYKNNISLGVGGLFYENKIQSQPMITVAVVKQITDKISFISDNFYLPILGTSNYYSYGFRVFGETIAVDFYFINSKRIANTIAVGFPVVGATIQL